MKRLQYHDPFLSTFQALHTVRVTSWVGLLILLSLFLPAPVDASTTAGATTVRFRLVDLASGKITPAMVCITGSDGKVRLPPDGRIVDELPPVHLFYRGVRFSHHRNWIGPVRQMQGPGDNRVRATAYESRLALPYWKEPVMYQTSGDFTIDLPAGRWRIAVQHGMEYIPVVEEFTTREKGLLSKTIELKRWIDMPKRGWWSGDVHVHHPTLEQAHREFLLHYAKAEDLHIVNLLEMGHHKGTDFKHEGFGKDYRVCREGYCLISGQEGPRSTFGHIIGLNINRMVRDTSTYDFYDLAFKGIHEQEGALVGFAHFAWESAGLPYGTGFERGFPWYVTTGELDFVELLQFSKINAMNYYEYLNLGFKLTAAGGSDVPWGSTIGEARTYVYTGPELNPELDPELDPKLDIDAWFAGLKKGHSFVSNGPVLSFTVDGQLPGSEVAKAAGEKVRIVARVESHPKIGIPKVLTLVGNRGVIKEVMNPDKRTDLTLELEWEIDQSQWFVVSTVCDNNALAHTTPIYVIVDGRPAWSPERGPAVVGKQLEAIDAIAKEFGGASDERSRGVIERLNRARRYYRELLTKMK